MKNRETLKVVSRHDFEIVRAITSQDTTCTVENFSHITIGFVVSGKKIVRRDSTSTVVSEGDIFILNVGLHFEENRIGENGKFEQILFRLSPHKLQQIIFSLNLNYGLQIANYHKFAQLSTSDIAMTRPDASLQKFFRDVDDEICRTPQNENLVRKRIKLNTLVLLLLTSADEKMKERLLLLADDTTTKFVSTIYENLYTECTNDELARRANMSLTTFKKMFQSNFGTTPRHWIVSQRLERAQFQLLTTRKTVSEVASECGFISVSNFIKLFKRTFGSTPNDFRKHSQTEDEV